MNNFNVKERQVGNVIVLDIRGNLNGCGCRGALRDAINRPLDEGHNQILLNLAKVSHMDSSCLGVLVSSHFYLNKRGGQLKIINLRDHLKELMTITQLFSVFDICKYENESEALKSFESPFDLEDYRHTLQSETYGELRPKVWGELGMRVTFLTELMLGRTYLERTFNVKELMSNDRVALNGIYGHYVEGMFEPVLYAVQ